MDAMLWAILGGVAGFAYFAAVTVCMMEAGHEDAWWEPFVLGVLVPIWWVYEHGRDIGALCLLMMVFGSVLAVTVGLAELAKWVWGML